MFSAPPRPGLLRRYLVSASRPCLSGANRGFAASYAHNRPLVEEETTDFLGKTGGRRAKQLPPPEVGCSSYLHPVSGRPRVAAPGEGSGMTSASKRRQSAGFTLIELL